MLRWLVERSVFVVEFDFLHLEAAAPLGARPADNPRAHGVLLGDEELYRFRVVKLGERIQAHRVNLFG